jgi:hypothetical protein
MSLSWKRVYYPGTLLAQKTQPYHQLGQLNPIHLRIPQLIKGPISLLHYEHLPT